MKVRTAIVEVLKAEPDWRQSFKRSCERGTRRLRSQIGKWQDDLADRGHNFTLADVEDALMDLARRFFPESAGAQWDGEWASRLYKDALARLGEHYAGLCEDERDRLDFRTRIRTRMPCLPPERRTTRPHSERR